MSAEDRLSLLIDRLLTSMDAAASPGQVGIAWWSSPMTFWPSIPRTAAPPR